MGPLKIGAVGEGLRRGVMRITIPFVRALRPGIPYRPRAQADFELIARFLAGRAGLAESNEMERWIGDDPARALLVRRLAEHRSRDARAGEVGATGDLRRLLATTAIGMPPEAR